MTTEPMPPVSPSVHPDSASAEKVRTDAVHADPLHAEPTVGPVGPMRRSSRDAHTIPAALADWLAAADPGRGTPEVSVGATIDANGMSSETIPITVAWPGTSITENLIMRMAPDPSDVPVFPHYRMDHQFEVMRGVADLTDLPVPTVRWLEPTGTVLGSPFFLMQERAGDVPPDVMPYPFGDNWLADASPAEQRRLQDSTIAAIAALHRVDEPVQRFGHLIDHLPPGPTPLARHLAWLGEWYRFGADAIGESPLVTRALAWLDRNFPTEVAADAPVLCWGDSRIGNIMYTDFTPTAILDWEMARIGPREADVSWLIFSHMVFQELVGLAGLPGLPDLLTEHDVRARYRDLTGIELGDLRWFHVYAAVQWCCVFMRAGARRVHFGELDAPEDIDGTLFFHRTLLERLIAEDLT